MIDMEYTRIILHHNILEPFSNKRDCMEVISKVASGKAAMNVT